MSERDERLLRLAADRAAQRPAYLAWILAQYMATESKSSTALRAELGCTDAALRRLALCRRPRSERFADDIAAIASELAVNAGALAGIVRRVEAAEAMARGGVVERGSLVAARKRRPQEDDKDHRGSPR